MKVEPLVETRTARITVRYLVGAKYETAYGWSSLQQRSDSIFCHWRVNRANGELVAFDEHTIAVVDNASNLDPFGSCLASILAFIEHYQIAHQPYFTIIDWSWNESTSDPHVIRNALRILEHARLRPGMFIGPPNIDAVIHWIHGFNAGCSIYGIGIEYGPGSIYQQIVETRGWEFLATRPWREMQERGLTEEAIIDELLTIEIESWRQTYALDHAPK